MKRGRHRHIKEKNEDRLSALPDDVLHHILSFLDTKPAVQSCILSKRWKNLWKSFPTLKLTSRQFTTLKAFTKFVSHILSHRYASTSLYNFDFNRSGSIEPQLLKRISKYVLSHNVQRLKIETGCSKIQLRPSIFSCQTLTSLNLSRNCNCDSEGKLFPNSLSLPALTNLSLKGFMFCVNDDGRVNPFSTLNSLNSLNIIKCICSECLCISSATLSNLTIETWFYMEKFQLSTPSLCTFDYSGDQFHCQKICGSFNNLSSVKHVNINSYCTSKSDKTPLVLLNWLIELTNTESLTISQNTLKVLSFVPDILKVEFPSLYNLKSLKITKYHYSRYIPMEVVNFLIQNAPSAKVDLPWEVHKTIEVMYVLFAQNAWWRMQYVEDYVMQNFGIQSESSKHGWILYNKKPFY